MIMLGNVQHGWLIGRATYAAFDPDIDRVISRVTRNDQFLGGVIYTNYTGSMVTMHMAGIEGWASPELLWVCFDYPFMQLKVKKVLGTVRSDNELACDIDERLGFTLEHEIEDGIPDGTLRIYSMTREQCRWLKLRKRYFRPNGHAGTPAHVHFEA